MSGMTDYRAPRGHLQALISTGYPDDPDSCWLWPGAKAHDGYGKINRDGRVRCVHRVAYELHVGPVPDGLMLDHTCHERACFNPAHLEPVTKAQNVQNRAGLGANNTSGHRGVTWQKRESCWRVQVRIDGACYHGGYFHSLNDAAAAAERLREELGVRDTTGRTSSQRKRATQ